MTRATTAQMPTAVAAPPAGFLPNPFHYVHHHITHFEGEDAFNWMVDSPHFPLLIATGYVMMVHIMPRLLDAVVPGSKLIPGVSIVIPIWNLFFSVGSCVGLLYCLPVLYRVVLTTDRDLPGLAPKKDWKTGAWDYDPHVRGGVYTSLCYWNRSFFLDGPTGFWLVTFNLSKILELADTLFLVLKRKPVPFIHWYHHTTVMLFCWHAHVSSISNGLGFAVMNMAVHSLMYFYYFMCACGLGNVARPFAPMVTLLQLVQMFAGMLLVLYTTGLYLLHPKGCDTSAASLAFGMGIYFSYIVLFIKLYRDRYGRKRRERRDRCEA
ncbi:putative mitochondrial fatty acid elongase, putative (ELO3.3) [Leptomonas pyrrhocoris]|uniref:Elongation of fatty acids protein n=1 Tax=Leptomonas pyrrhocoris TaxID=157538 RepID=A0A0N0VE34_LEPPY|nr:putative mitochondrial fatty acid elongase, putative (ELO3.3) [Leptomonas pyrrhocoris]KPA77251.1 putative mitochondrial fatty acid elongase, putative (ELO3.3) [Leptomonas pyrrhocoris]|eukprot:XP_015655690.1 putative mitochondrial fatty acid elongase, putative (ELO3.3) [Leptomonas pyrrhocoris]